MNENEPFDRQAFDAQTEAIEKAINEAVREALIVHKRLGHSIVVCEGDKILVIPPESIVIPEIDPGP